ncbi:PLDc N-terminal domain-containing protein [Streptococcus dentiloxodontae]
MSLKLLIPLMLLVLFYVGFCWYDIFTSRGTRYLSKGIWALLCLLSMPLGGVMYFILGRLGKEDDYD